MTRRVHLLGKALAATVGLAVALAGVPVALSMAGQGLPDHVISARALGHGLQHPLTDATLLRGISLACWVVWVLFAAAVLIEVVGCIRAHAGRSRLRLQIPGLQGVAGSLVVTAMLLWPQRALPPVSAHRPLPVMQAAVAAQPMPTAAGPEPVMGPPSPTAGMEPYTVQRYDSLWRIAEQRLGDGTRWREIRDARGGPLTAGQAVTVDGYLMHRPELRIIYPGEVLLVPPGPPPAPGAVGATSVAPIPVAPPAPSPAAPSPAVPSPAVPSPAAPSGPPETVQPGTASPETAPTERAQPETPAPSPAPPETAWPGGGASPADEPPILRAVPNGQAAGDPQDRPSALFKAAAADHHDGRTGSSTLSTTLLEAGLLSAAVVGTLHIFRRRQAQHRPAGRRVRLPGPAVAATEMALRTGEAPDQVELVDRALRSLVEDLHSAGMTAPTIQAVVAGPDSVELLIDRPLPPPPPWTSAAEGFRWRISPEAIRPAPPDRSAPLPALVPVGEAAGGGAQVLINLEAAGLVGVVGAGDRAAGTVRAVTIALSGLPWAGAVDVIAVGFGQGLDVVEHVRVADRLGPLLDELHTRARVMRTVIGGVDPFHGRVDGRAIDGWPPTIVCCSTGPTGEELASLAELTAPGSGVLAIVAGGQGLASWTVDVDGAPMAIHPLRLAIEPTVLTEVELAGVSQLYEIAQDDRGSTADQAPYDRIELSAERSLSERLARLDTGSSRNGDAAPELPSRPPVLIGVLGTVEIDGGSEFKRAKSRELAVYLALHPGGVGEAELDEAMWPSQTGRLVAASTRDSTVSVARTALGGPGRLLPAQLQGREKRYQVSPDVGTDWAQFCQLHRWGRASGDPARLRQALDLVRGRPFEGVLAARTYGWVHTEGHARHMEAEVGDAADLAAELLLASGQPVEARWAARRGLLADPYVERLWVRLMEAADQLGDSQEIERIMDEMDTVLELGGDFSSLHPQTLAAYDRLSRRHRLPG